MQKVVAECLSSEVCRIFEEETEVCTRQVFAGLLCSVLPLNQVMLVVRHLWEVCKLLIDIYTHIGLTEIV